MTEAASGHLIELRVNNVAQLFHTLDPFPFREREGSGRIHRRVGPRIVRRSDDKDRDPLS